MYDYTKMHQLQIDQSSSGLWYLSWPDGSRFDEQLYVRHQDAKRARTILLQPILKKTEVLFT